MNTPSQHAPVGILGGTFDPVHFGHLRMALSVYQALNLQEVRFLPCQTPVLKQASTASVQQRLDMLTLAIDKQPGFVIDERELQRDTPSYTYETLISLRDELGEQSICMIIGSDAFQEFHKWYRWQELIKLAHLVVISREGKKISLPRELMTFYQQHQTQDIKTLSESPAGYIFQQTLPILEIASSEIRRQLASGLSPRYLLPDSVLRYIREHKIYSDKPLFNKESISLN